MNDLKMKPIPSSAITLTLILQSILFVAWLFLLIILLYMLYKTLKSNYLRKNIFFGIIVSLNFTSFFYVLLPCLIIPNVIEFKKTGNREDLYPVGLYMILYSAPLCAFQISILLHFINWSMFYIKLGGICKIDNTSISNNLRSSQN